MVNRTLLLLSGAVGEAVPEHPDSRPAAIHKPATGARDGRTGQRGVSKQSQKQSPKMDVRNPIDVEIAILGS